MELRRSYEGRTATTVEESSFYDRFTPGLVKLLQRIVGRVLTRTATALRQLTEGLAGFRDLVVLDATVLRLHDLLAGTFAACRTNHTQAAATLHVAMSVTRATATRVRLTPERTNERTP